MPVLATAAWASFMVNGFPSFLPKEVERIRDPSARELAKRIQRLPVKVSLLKSVPLRLYANILAFNKVSLSRSFDWTNIGRLHCLFPWWEDATIDFMFSGGYNVRHQIKQVKQKTLILWGENDRIINTELALRLRDELPNSVFHQIPDCGHLPHVEKPEIVSDFILKFVRGTAVEKPASSAVQGIVPRS